jgi:hypothetical protein
VTGAHMLSRVLLELAWVTLLQSVHADLDFETHAGNIVG